LNACTCTTMRGGPLLKNHEEGCAYRRNQLAVNEALASFKYEMDRLCRLAHKRHAEGDCAGVASLAQRLHSIGG
jgi:hypothetical protein